MKNENENPGELNGKQVQIHVSDRELEALKNQAEVGNADAQLNLGCLLERIGMEEEAMVWYKKASDQGDWRASRNIAELLRYEDNNKSDEYFRKMANQKDERFFGIQAFDNPTDAWEVMQDYWGKAGCRDTQYLYVLDDNGFKHALLYRVVDCLCQEHFGLITKEECEKKLDTSPDVIYGYLLNFNYFHYSKKSGRYYTSRMEEKYGYYKVWSDRQWGIFKELENVHNFKEIVLEARKFFQSNIVEINVYGKDNYRDFIDNYEFHCFVYFG